MEKMKFYRLFFFLIIGLFFNLSPDSKTLKDKSLISGIGKPPIKKNLTAAQKRLLARRAAIVVAYRNILKYSKKYDEKKWEIKPYQKIDIKGRVKGAKIVKTIYYKDGRVKVIIKIPKEGVK
jgi:hypothetical protein